MDHLNPFFSIKPYFAIQSVKFLRLQPSKAMDFWSLLDDILRTATQEQKILKSNQSTKANLQFSIKLVALNAVSKIINFSLVTIINQIVNFFVNIHMCRISLRSIFVG
jgi:hypothetical protein